MPKFLLHGIKNKDGAAALKVGLWKRKLHIQNKLRRTEVNTLKNVHYELLCHQCSGTIDQPKCP